MSVLQPMVSDPRDMVIHGIMDTILKEVSSGKDKLIHRSVVNFESCISKIPQFANDPTTCRRFIDVTFEHFPSYIPQVVSRLLDHVEKGDTSILIYLVDRLIESGNMSLATSVFVGLGPGQDLALREYVLGVMAYDVGSKDEARQHFIRTILTDPSFYRAYSFLNEIDPSFGWIHMANVDRIMSNVDPVLTDAPVENDREELFFVCKQWSQKDWVGSIAAIRRIRAFENGDPFTMTVFARMSAKLGAYRDAIEYYDRALKILKDSEYISVELAIAYGAIGHYDEALSVLRKVRAFNPYSSRILLEEYISLINDRRVHDAEHTLNLLLSSAELDAEKLVRCITVLQTHDMVMDAANLTKRVAVRCIDQSYGEYLLATNAMYNGDFRTAISHANAALRIDKSFIGARCIRAKAYLKTDGVFKAMEDVNRMLDDSPNDIMVLNVKKDIHMMIKNYDDALEICNLMLGLDSRNPDVLMDRAVILGHIGDYKGSLDSYREAMNIREDIRMFISILHDLLKQRRISDLCRLVDDFDDVFGKSTAVWRIRGNAEYLDQRYDDAIVSYENAASLSPNDGVIWHSKGLAEEAAGYYADAEDSFGKALLSDLENTEYWISKAIIQEKRGNFKGSIVSLNKVISSANSGVFVLVLKARVLAKCGRVREALYFLDQAQILEPYNTDIMRMSKDAYMHLNEYDRVIPICRRINSITGGDHGATVDLAYAYLVIGQVDSATEVLNSLVKEKDLTLETLSKCATSFHMMGDYYSEVKVLERALATSSDDRQIIVRLAEAYTVCGDKGRAATLYSRLEENDPGDVHATVSKVMLEVGSDEPLADDPVTIAEDRDSLMDLAQRSLESGMEDDALNIYRKVMDMDPDCAEAHVAVMDILLGRGDIVDAVALGSDSVHLFPNDARIPKLLGDAYRSTGDDDRAVESYTQAIRLGMDTAEIHDSVGVVFGKVGMVQMSLDHHRIAVEKDPQNLEYRSNLASMELKLGHESEAESMLNSILVVDPGNIRALRMYVTLCVNRNDSEAILALFDDILSVVTDADDIGFFESILREIGEDHKADRLAEKVQV